MYKIILYGGILLAIFITIMFNSHDYAKLFHETCMLTPKIEILQFLDEYEQSRQNVSILSYYLKVNISIGVIMGFMVIFEMMIYVMFFRYMYKHDNNPRLRRLLEPKVIKGRNRKNAISFIGQFCSFVVEVTKIVLVAIMFTIGNNDNKLTLVAIVFAQFAFPLMSMVEVLTSDVLRRRLPRINLYNIIFGW